MADGLKNTLYGWGYEGRSVEDLVTYVQRAGAHVVVDIRLNPISRKRGFSKRALTAHLHAAGLVYMHLPALGNPVDNRAGFAIPDSADAATAHERFTTEVLDAQGAVEALGTIADLLQEGPVVLLCFEADQRSCHRSLVIEALQQAPVPA